jgi:AsmA-like C-terminal region
MQQVLIPTPSTNTRKLVVLALLVMAAIVFAAVVLLALRWPFTRAAVLKQLEDASLSRVDAGSFHGTYFPRPGCVLERVTFQHNPKPGTPTLITVEKIRIEGSFPGLFTKHVKRIRAEGMHILTPPRGTEHFQIPERSTVVIDDLIADGAILEVSREADKQALKFSFHNFDLSNIGGKGPASFQAKFSNPEPPGEITALGKFGPWSAEDLGKTAVSGEYLFQQADLGVFSGIAGLLSSSGKFSGVLDHIEVQGQTDTPRFAVTSSSHQVRLRTQFHAVVNGENGDTFLQQVAATFWKTTVSSQGSVAGRAGQPGKTASVELATKNGRIQDILLLFARSKRAPMSGVTSFRAKVSIPPGTRPFLEKVELQGDFGINAGTFTNSSTQEGVNHLSEGALSSEQDQRETEKNEDDPETVLSDLQGHVVLKDGTARLSNLSFSVPGASAQMQGTYNLITGKIDLHGTLRADSQPSKITSGVKALLLKVLNPFFKKKPVGYVMPVKIEGTYAHPSFGLDLSDSHDKKPYK